MNLSEIEKRVTSSSVNDRLRKTFSYEIDFTNMTPELAFDMISETKKEIPTQNYPTTILKMVKDT